MSVIPRFWIVRHAFRDTRGVRRQLTVFLSSMMLGVAALVAINSIGANLTAAVDDQAKSLLGADLRVSSRSPFSPEAEALIDSIGGDQARLYSFSSMALAPSTDRTRLVGVRASDPGYPFYGEIVTDPGIAASAYQGRDGLLADPTVLLQLGISIGDSLRIGSRSYPVVGSIQKTSRETSAMESISPRVYVPRAALDTLLLAYGSRVEYEVYVKFDDGTDADELVDGMKSRLREVGLRYSTVEREKREWNEALTNLYRFLGLIAFVALLLGGLGVASSINVYIRRRLASVAVLRCLGATPAETSLVYLLQALALGLIGSIVGAFLGVGIQQLIPPVVNRVSPLQIEPVISLSSVATGIVVGTGVGVLFALLPILQVGRVSPLSVLRHNQGDDQASRSWSRRLVVAVGVAGFAAAAAWQAPSPLVGIAYVVGLIFVFLVLRLVARVLTVAARGLRTAGLSFEVRQGIASLFRPGSQTVLLTVTIGFIAFIIFALSGVRSSLLRQVELSSGSERPNLILFDIQPDQVDGVTSIVRASGNPVIESVPIVSMRIRSINGRLITSMREDETVETSWAHRREYRSSYRDTLNDTETLTSGRMLPSVPPDFDPAVDVVPVTMASDLEDELKIGIGDSLVFDVQGLPVRTVIGGIRDVDWGQLSTNFYFLFPRGVLEDAPSTNVVVTRVDDAARMSAVQTSVIDAFPNVSAIDLTLVLSVVESVFSRIGMVIRFLALFCVLTGMIVLVGSVLSGQSSRTEESVLLKTLGAAPGTIQGILATEYAAIGVIATASGLVLSTAAVWLLCRYNFNIPPRFPAVEYLLFGLAIVGITIGVGMLLSRSVYKQSPLAILRNEL
ncbi:MAG: ABC transporter permease [Bacteroidetes bacterium]|nr:ABC transporter permease [Bacteroidota bacterium]